jgi:hypothetical protein
MFKKKGQNQHQQLETIDLETGRIGVMGETGIGEPPKPQYSLYDKLIEIFSRPNEHTVEITKNQFFQLVEEIRRFIEKEKK